MTGEDRSRPCRPCRPYRRFGARGRAWPALGLVVLALFALPALGILAPGILAPSWPASAATGAEPGGSNAPRRVAFVVGNSNYRSIATLANPSRDALAVAEALERVGFEVTRVIDGDRQGLADALASFAERSRGSDIVLFYYAGHGVQINGENDLLPVSIEVTETESILEQSISISEVRERLSEADPGLTLFMLDSCRNNPFGPMAARSGGETGARLVIGQGMARMSGAAGLLIAYATQPGAVALDGTGLHSPFTAALLRHIEAPGLEIRLLLGRVREDVVANTAGHQVPWVEEAVLGEFYFSEPTFGDGERPIAGSGEHDLIFWRSVWRSIDRGITDIALPAFRQLEQRLAGKAEGVEILAEAKRQLDAMGQRRDSVARQFERASESYLTVVAAAGSGYAERVRAASLGRSRAGGYGKGERPVPIVQTTTLSAARVRICNEKKDR